MLAIKLNKMGYKNASALNVEFENDAFEFE